MTASAAGLAGFPALFFASEDKLGLIDKFCEHISHREGEGDKH